MTDQNSGQLSRLQHSPGESQLGSGDCVVVSSPAPGVGEIVLNRPAARNSLSLAMLQALKAGLDAMVADDTVKVIILSATGPVFSAGHDLKELTSHRSDSDQGREFFTTVLSDCSSVMQAIVNAPKPIIAAVQGTATAAGCQLVASCDLAIASDQANFCTPGVNIGLFCSTPMVALTRNASRKHAMEMLLTGDMITAATAADFGLVNKVVSHDRLRETALDLAMAIARKSAATLRIGKQTFYRQLEMPLSEAYDYASAVMVENMLAPDAEEGICAFLEKRAPDWKAR